MDFTERFKHAVSHADAAALRQLFAEHPEWKSRIDDPLFAFDQPAIVIAAGSGKRELIDALLEMGARIDARSTWWAGSFGVLDNDRHDIAAYLIERGAKVDAHAAARHGMLDKLRALIDANPELVHARGGDGQTPLHVASSVEIAGFLLDRGAAIDALDIDHESTPAQYLIRSHPEIVTYLIGRGCKTDILMASAAGDAALVRRHLETDPQSIRTRVNAQYFPMRNPRAGGTIYCWTLGNNRSAHQVASGFGHPAVLDLLFEYTPEDMKLAQACLTGNATVARDMIAQNAGAMRAIAQSNPSYVSDAAEYNNAAAVRLMLEAGWRYGGRWQTHPAALGMLARQRRNGARHSGIPSASGSARRRLSCDSDGMGYSRLGKRHAPGDRRLCRNRGSSAARGGEAAGKNRRQRGGPGGATVGFDFVRMLLWGRLPGVPSGSGGLSIRLFACAQIAVPTFFNNLLACFQQHNSNG